MKIRESVRLAGLSGSIAIFGRHCTVGAVTDCCKSDTNACCPQPSFGDRLNGMRVVPDKERCCSNSSGSLWCAPYGVPGCTFCRDSCHPGSEDSCVQCPAIADADPHGLSENDMKPDDMNWVSDIHAILSSGSYDFGDDDDGFDDSIDCSSCSSETHLARRLLTERSRAMVCDPSCLDGGNELYGVTLCNYFNAGKACRACCQESNMIEGCMPCEESCAGCTDAMDAVCDANPCGAGCRAYTCCAMKKWMTNSGCETTLKQKVAQLVEAYGRQCDEELLCETAITDCSESAHTCHAHMESSRLEQIDPTSCRMVRAYNALELCGEYDLLGAIDDSIFYAPRKVEATSHLIQSNVFDACENSELTEKPFMAMLISHSASGYLTWDGGVSEDHSQIGGNCHRRLWSIADSSHVLGYSFYTVDPAVYPQDVVADWVRLVPSGEMTLSDVEVVCSNTTMSGDRAMSSGFGTGDELLP